ncbi:MAG: hypothetical protein M1820_005909 [Bogoriella megaspora]|nr:MAG: hypothetical protein M1820_005909 [Bogoriella megaspora]
MKASTLLAASAALFPTTLASPTISRATFFNPLTTAPGSTTSSASHASTTSLTGTDGSCTLRIFKPLHKGIDCTFYSSVTTTTSFVECNGCGLETARVAPGIACQKETTLPHATTSTAYACKMTQVPPFAPIITDGVVPESASAVPSGVNIE